jgi:hypothetical protein
MKPDSAALSSFPHTPVALPLADAGGASTSAFSSSRPPPTLVRLFDANFLEMGYRRARTAPAPKDLLPRLLLDARTDLLDATMEMEKATLELRWARRYGCSIRLEAQRQQRAARTWADALQAFRGVVPLRENVWGDEVCQPFLRFLNPVPDDDAVEMVAFHEAGHAVVGTFLGVEIGHVTLVPDPDRRSLGRVTIRTTPLNPWPSQIRADVLMSFAGQYAACRRFPDHVPDGFQDDVFKARECIARCSPRAGHRRKLEQELRERSLWLVDQLWPAIGDLASRLTKKETLSAGEVEESFACIPRSRRQALIDHPWALRRAMDEDFEAEVRRCRLEREASKVEFGRAA